MTSRSPERTAMFAEAAEAADAIERQLRLNGEAMARVARDFAMSPPAIIVTCARGSSDHAASYARHLFETTLGIVTSSIAPSIGSIYGALPAIGNGICIAISQSGQSPDLLEVVARMSAAGARTLAITNQTRSPLAAIADHTIALQAGPERSVAATKSTIASLVAALDLVAHIKPDPAWQARLAMLPGQLRAAWELDWSPLVEHLVDATGLYVIGRGPGLGIAAEAALKFKETCGLHAEAFSAAEVRHGPMALIGKDFPLLVFRQHDASAAGVERLAQEVAARGAPVFMVGADAPGAICLPAISADPLVEPVLQLQSFYRAANALGLRRGFDPDNPPLLRKVTETL